MSYNVDPRAGYRFHEHLRKTCEFTHCSDKKEEGEIFCAKHKNVKCVSCEEQATKPCNHVYTDGSTCGELVCSECTHNALLLKQVRRHDSRVKIQKYEKIYFITEDNHEVRFGDLIHEVVDTPFGPKKFAYHWRDGYVNFSYREDQKRKYFIDKKNAKDYQNSIKKPCEYCGKTHHLTNTLKGSPKDICDRDL